MYGTPNITKLLLNLCHVADFNVNFLNSQHLSISLVPRPCPASCHLQEAGQGLGMRLSLYHQLSCILSSFNLTQVVPQPTHVSTNGGATLIDR